MVWCLTRPLMFMDLPLQVTSTAAWLSPLSDVMNCYHGHLTPPPHLFKDLPLRVTTAAAWSSPLSAIMTRCHGHLTPPPAVLPGNCPPVMAAASWVLCLRRPLLPLVDLPLPTTATSALARCLTRPLLPLPLPLLGPGATQAAQTRRNPRLSLRCGLRSSSWRNLRLRTRRTPWRRPGRGIPLRGGGPRRRRHYYRGRT